jgi:hypothetical protein
MSLKILSWECRKKRFVKFSQYFSRALLDTLCTVENNSNFSGQRLQIAFEIFTNSFCARLPITLLECSAMDPNKNLLYPLVLKLKPTEYANELGFKTFLTFSYFEIFVYNI